MSVYEDIKQKQLQVRKERNENLIGLMTTLLSDINTKMKETGSEPTDAMILPIVTKYLSGNAEMLKALGDRGDTDTPQLIKAEAEKIVLTELHSKLTANFYSEEKLNELLDEFLSANGKDSIDSSDKKMYGMIMKHFNSTHRGKFNNELLQKVIKDRTV